METKSNQIKSAELASEILKLAKKNKSTYAETIHACSVVIAVCSESINKKTPND